MPISKKAIQFTACKACGCQTQIPSDHHTNSKNYIAWRDLFHLSGICWGCCWDPISDLHPGVERISYFIRAYSYYLV